jgi:hypothetical protein
MTRFLVFPPASPKRLRRFFMFYSMFYAGFCAPLPMYSVPLNTLVDTGQVPALLNKEAITEAQFNAPKPLLAPRHEAVRAFLAAALGEVEPSFFVETLYLYKKPPHAGEVWNDSERRALFNRTLALSTLTGIQYYSSSRKAMRTFYEISTVIDGPDTRRPLADPARLDLPPRLTLYARQKDLTFGDNIYTYTYHNLPDSLVFVQRNETALSVGIIPAVGKGKLRSIIAVVDAEAYLLVYLSSMAKAASLPGMNQRVGQSFSTRADAVLRWFTGQADKAFAAPNP